ncbi:MAG: MerR family transcriptional regulator [Blastocatellia bacterium]
MPTITATIFTENFNTITIDMGQAAVVIPEKIYFKIGEVCEIVGVQAHVLRYWETEFPMLSPQKNRSGQRSYRRRDVEISLRIKELLYDEMFTIAGAKKKLQNELRETTKLKVVHPEPRDTREFLKTVESPGLFDESLELEDDSTTSAGHREAEFLSPERREALRSLASQLLELREMLKTDQTHEAQRNLQNQ